MSRSLTTEIAEPVTATGEGGSLWTHNLGIQQPEFKNLSLSPLPEPAGPGVAAAPTPVQPPEVMRFLASRPDPKDPSHFTIDYVLDGQPGVIDGWLQDDNRVRIEPRQGAKRLGGIDGRGGEEYWDPYATTPAAPATAPAGSPAPSR
jgi:hypothetical protein